MLFICLPQVQWTKSSQKKQQLGEFQSESEPEPEPEPEPDMPAKLSSRQFSPKFKQPGKRIKTLQKPLDPLKPIQSSQRTTKSPKKRKQQAAETARSVLPQNPSQEIIRTGEQLRSPKKASKARNRVPDTHVGDQARVDETSVRPRKIAKKENGGYVPACSSKGDPRARLWSFRFARLLYSVL